MISNVEGKMIFKTCFQCSQPINEDQYSGVRVHGSMYDFHRNCAREIVAGYVIEALRREADTEARAKEYETAYDLADRLDYQPHGDK